MLKIEKMITIDNTGMPVAPSVTQLLDKDLLLLYKRDTSKDKSKYIAECGVIYYLGDPKSPAKQQGLTDKEALAMAVDNFDLPKTYVPDNLVTKLIGKYYKQNITEAGVALEVLQKSIHLVSISANRINDTLNAFIANPTIELTEISQILTIIDSVNKRISEIPSLTKALKTAYENLQNEEEDVKARGGKSILSSMNGDEDVY